MGGKLDGKVAIVTGGGTGIGRATAKRFAAEGAHVFITGRRQAELDAAAQAIGGTVTAVPGSVTNLADLDRLYEAVQRARGHVDIVFANAASGTLLPLGAITERHVDEILATNIKGVIFTVQKALPLMRDGGSIILVSSTSGSRAAPAFSVYGASKAAIRQLARGWAFELRQRRIRVNALSPGPIDTPGLNGLVRTEAEAQQMKVRLAAAIPLGRVGEADEVGKAAVFLASDDSSFVNGIELFVDGGMAQI